MRNFIKPAGSPARHRARGLAAVFASVALAAGLGAYPAVQAEEPTAANDIVTDDAGLPTYSWMEDGTPSSSATPSAPAAAPASKPASASASKPAEAPATANPVTVERKGDVDRITINDPEGEAWEFGGKASKENIFALKREGKGEIKEVLSVTADGRKLEPYDYGYVNAKDGGFVAFNLNALHTIPSQVVEIEVHTTDAGEYAIAESDEVPSEAELAESGYGKGRPAEEAPKDGVRRASGELTWSAEQRLDSPIVGAGTGQFEGLTGTKRYIEVNPTGSFPGQANQDIRITRIVLKNIENNTLKPNLEWAIDKNGNEKYSGKGTPVKGSSGRDKGVEMRFFDPETGATPVPGSFIIWSGSDKLKIATKDIPAWTSNVDTLKKRYEVEAYGSFQIRKEPETEEPAPEPEASVQGETTIGNATFRVVSKTDPKNPLTLSEVNTTGANPYKTTAMFDRRSEFTGAVVEVKAPNSVLAVEQYGFHIDMLESGVKLGRKVLHASSDSVTFEVFPIKDGKPVDSVLVEKGATLTAISRFSDRPGTIDTTITVKGTKYQPKAPDTKPITRPSDEKWLVERLPNPKLVEKCGLKVAIVADLSTSLKYADTDGFDASRQAATTMVDALAGTPTEVGIYHFGTFAGTDTDAISVQNQEGVETVKNAIKKWNWNENNSATNWEGGLKEVQNKNYDVVYFITDGMPTWDETGWQPLKNKNGGPPTGAFVQETSLNQAIIAANTLKAAGTRVVPIMVDLKLKAGNTVERDYVLRDALPNGAEGSLKAGRIRFQREKAVPSKEWENLKPAVYDEPGGNIIVNIEEAQKRNYWTFYRNGDKKPDVTDNQDAWTRGLREVRQMGVDISDEEAPIRLSDYGQLSAQLTKIADELKTNCAGTFTVQKRIVKPNGEVEIERAEGWEFAVDAGDNVLDEGSGELKSQSTRKTGADGEVRWRTLNDESAKFSVVETRKDPYRIFPRDDANAVCSIRDTADSETSFNLPIASNKEDGINVDIPGYSHVTCVFDNYEPKDEFVKLELKKLDATDKSVLSNAKFEVRSEREGDGPFEVTWDESSRTYKTEAKLVTGKPYFLVETQAPTKDGQQYSLLVAPVEFQIVSSEGGGYTVQVRDGQGWTSELVGAGLWTERPNKFDAATGYLQVANVRQGNLPKTGGMGVQLPILLGGALIAAGALIGRRKVAA